LPEWSGVGIPVWLAALVRVLPMDILSYPSFQESRPEAPAGACTETVICSDEESPDKNLSFCHRSQAELFLPGYEQSKHRTGRPLLQRGL
jgi:hypothetical protein